MPKMIKSKKAKKSKKVAEEETVEETKGSKRKNTKGTIAAKDISPKGLKLISKVNALENEIIEKKDELAATLAKIVDEVGVTYVDPERKKAMSISQRGDLWFLRTKPNGGVAKRLKTMKKNGTKPGPKNPKK
jgi:hypothetical protein